ncbi:hypothetical protein ILYODFUR_004425 [Ilyodon furcidens]|uniref:Secreted protein n=1 Tax=Ilyodon furcidens TaxID=33524 RepID=A0ABV0V2B9_9TELE
MVSCYTLVIHWTSLSSTSSSSCFSSEPFISGFLFWSSNGMVSSVWRSRLSSVLDVKVRGRKRCLLSLIRCQVMNGPCHPGTTAATDPLCTDTVVVKCNLGDGG